MVLFLVAIVPSMGTLAAAEADVASTAALIVTSLGTLTTVTLLLVLVTSGWSGWSGWVLGSTDTVMDERSIRYRQDVMAWAYKGAVLLFGLLNGTLVVWVWIMGRGLNLDLLVGVVLGMTTLTIALPGLIEAWASEDPVDPTGEPSSAATGNAR